MIDSGDSLQIIEQEPEMATYSMLSIKDLRDSCYINVSNRDEAMRINQMLHSLLKGKGTPADYELLEEMMHHYPLVSYQPIVHPLSNTLPTDLYWEMRELEVDGIGPPMTPAACAVKMPVSTWDSLFHPSLDVDKVKEAITGFLSDKVDGIKRWYVIYRVLAEINWLTDRMSTHFIAWVREVFGWEWSTTDFKRVRPEFKNTPTTKWDGNTVKDRQTGIIYGALAAKIRNRFVETGKDGAIIDRVEFLRRPDLYIAHPK